MSLYTVKAIIVLEASGARVVAKYYVNPDDELATLKNQEAFESKMFKKAVRQHVLNTLRDSLDILLTDTQVDKRRLLENLDYLLLVIDELVDNGIFLEHDAHSIANRVAQKSPFEDDTIPLAEQTVSQVLGQVGELTRSFLSSYAGQ